MDGPMNATDRLEPVDDQHRKRLMVDELIEQLIRRQIAEASSVLASNQRSPNRRQTGATE
jgi:hypothetical protein